MKRDVIILKANRTGSWDVWGIDPFCSMKKAKEYIFLAGKKEDTFLIVKKLSEQIWI